MSQWYKREFWLSINSSRDYLKGNNKETNKGGQITERWEKVKIIFLEFEEPMIRYTFREYKNVLIKVNNVQNV